MVPGDAVGLFAGAVALGAVHGVEPGHGWPVAASYALERSNRWLYGLAAGLLIGLGHLLSSIAMVALFFYLKSYFQLTQVNEPLTVLGGVRIGGPVSLVAGVLLIGLGVREYRGGHSHGHGEGGHAHEHSGDDGDHAHSHGPHTDHERPSESTGLREGGVSAVRSVHVSGVDHVRPLELPGRGDGNGGGDAGRFARLRAVVPAGSHSHDRADLDGATDRGLLGIAWFAFVLGFAHEEEFEIIALCAGSDYCLELMGVYALTVVVGIVGLTLLLIAGYQRYERRVRRYTPYLPVFSAVVLVLMGVGFVLGLF